MDDPNIILDDAVQLSTLKPQVSRESQQRAFGPDKECSSTSDRLTIHNESPLPAEKNARLICEEDDAAENTAARMDVPPDGGYGWVCVVCVFVINGNTWGINSAYGVILSYFLTHNTFPGASALEYAFVGGLSISQALIVAPVSTLTTRHFGMRVTLFIGIVLQTAALLGASFATDIWHLFLSQGVCFGWGMGFLYVGCAPVIPQWFTTRRSLANGICASGAGIWGLAYNLAAGAMIPALGIAWTYRILAASGCFFTVISSLLTRNRNLVVQPNQQALNFRLFRRTEFLLLLGWGFFSQLGYPVLTFTLPAYGTSVGLTAKQGSIVGALLNLGLGFGRPFVGYYSDTVGRINIATVMTAFCGVVCLVVWVFAKSFGVLCFFALLAGTSCGTFWATIVPVTAEVCDLKGLPSMLSMLWPVLVIPTTFAEVIALRLRRPTGDVYLMAQLFTGAMYLGAALCVWLLRPWKISQLEQEAAQKHREDDGPTELSVLEPVRLAEVALIRRRVTKTLKNLVVSKKV